MGAVSRQAVGEIEDVVERAIRYYEWWAGYILPESEGCIYCYEGSPQPCIGHMREEKYIIARTWVGEALDQQFD